MDKKATQNVLQWTEDKNYFSAMRRSVEFMEGVSEEMGMSKFENSIFSKVMDKVEEIRRKKTNTDIRQCPKESMGGLHEKLKTFSNTRSHEESARS